MTTVFKFFLFKTNRFNTIYHVESCFISHSRFSFCSTKSFAHWQLDATSLALNRRRLVDCGTRPSISEPTPLVFPLENLQYNKTKPITTYKNVYNRGLQINIRTNLFHSHDTMACDIHCTLLGTEIFRIFPLIFSTVLCPAQHPWRRRYSFFGEYEKKIFFSIINIVWPRFFPPAYHFETRAIRSSWNLEQIKKQNELSSGKTQV